MTLRIDVLTLFPGMFVGSFGESIIGRAVERNLVTIGVHNLRDYTHDKHHITDDYPYGGGAGMVMKPEPFFEAVEALTIPGTTRRVVLTCPQGEPYTQAKAIELQQSEHLMILCGHYEGVDERVRQALVTDEISIGDYVLSGGELAAMVIVDSLVRLTPGAIGSFSSACDDSFYDGLLGFPQYTRPPVYRGLEVPELLLGGHHEKVRLWRRKQCLLRTLERRPELLERVTLSTEDQRLLREIQGIPEPPKRRRRRKAGELNEGWEATAPSESCP